MIEMNDLSGGENVGDKKYLTTKQVAETLDISASTVRRWANKGYLKNIRVGESGYRRFDYEDIIKVKKEFLNPKSRATTKSEASKNQSIITEPIPPETHPKHYMMHKYWGRKAHNIVKEYITKFTKEGDIILDPFMGSGVTVTE